ncbi:MAG: hypothetical protein P1V97_33280, partial [Planctomycetota bacterium]|nr:hypothetical protein [Planctomycetota bacterium]
LDGKVVLDALCQSGLLKSTDDRVKLAKADAVVRIVARGFAQEKRSPWSEDDLAVLLLPEAVLLARELAWAGLSPELVLEPLSKMPPYVSEEAAQIAVAMCSRVEEPLSSKSLRLLEPLWKRCLADMNRLIQSASGFGEEITAVFEDLVRLSWNQVNKLPELDLNDEALKHCSLSVGERLSVSYFGVTQGEFESLGEEKSNLCCFMALAPFQTGQSLFSALKNSPELVKLRNNTQRAHLKSRQPILWEVVDEMAKSGNDQARDLLIGGESGVAPQIQLRHARIKVVEGEASRGELENVLIGIFRSSWGFFRANEKLREEVALALRHIEPWAQAAILGSSLCFSPKLPEDLDADLAALMTESLARPLLLIEDALDLAKKAKALIFLERIAQLPFEFLPKLDLGLIGGHPVFRLNGGGFGIENPCVESLLEAYVDNDFDAATGAWAVIIELASRAASILAELGHSESAIRLVLADDLDEGFVKARMKGRWTEAVSILLQCERGRDCPVHRFNVMELPSEECCVEPQVGKLFTDKMIGQLSVKKPVYFPGCPDLPILIPKPDLESFPFPLNSVAETRQNARNSLAKGSGHRYQLALMLAHYDVELAQSKNIASSLLPKLSDKERRRGFEKVVPSFAKLFGAEHSEVPKSMLKALNSFIDSGERVDPEQLDYNIRRQLLPIIKRRIHLSSSVLKHGDNTSKRMIAQYLSFGPSGNGSLPRKPLVLGGWVRKRAPRSAQKIREELLLERLSEKQIIDLCWDLADSKERKAALVDFAVKSIPKKGRGAPSLEFWRPWGHEALKAASLDKQEFLLGEMVVTQHTAGLLGELLKSPSIKNRSTLCVRLSCFDTKHLTFRQVIKAWTNSEQPWESFQN